MIQKIFLGITFVMLFALVACNSSSLAEYKTTTKAEIETYAQERRSNYCEEN